MVRLDEGVHVTEPLVLIRTFPQPAAAIFDAWTTPSMMRKWLFASDRGELVQVDSNPVVGGRYSIVEHLEGQEIDHFGEYLVVDPPGRLRFTLSVPQHFPEPTVIDLDISATEGRTQLRFVQSGIDPSKTRPFWEQMLSQLANVLD